jgi:hypothetical protein
MSHVFALWHCELEILEGRSLRHLPMESSRCQGLPGIIRLQWHVPQIELKVPDMAEELVLVDVPLVTASRPVMSETNVQKEGKGGSVPPGNVDIRVNEPYAGEVTTSFDDWSVVRVTYELGIIKSTAQSVIAVQDSKMNSPVKTYWMIGVQTL